MRFNVYMIVAGILVGLAAGPSLWQFLVGLLAVVIACIGGAVSVGWTWR